MRRAIRIHRWDFAAVTVLVALSLAVVGFILEHQPAFTFGQSYYTVRAQFQSAAAVTAGQGQSVTIAGVQVGLIGGVQLQDGHAVVTMDIYKKYAPIYRNATVLLRPRTPLKDMYLALDPGTPSAGAIPSGGVLGEASTDPTIDVDQILSSLDADSRTYLLLLLSGGAQAVHGNTAALRGTFQRFAPLNRDTSAFTSLLAQRSDNIRRAIHNLRSVVGALGGVAGELSSLVRASNADFGAIAAQDRALESGLTLLPGALRQTSSTLGQVRAFAAQTAPALAQLQPFARELAPALAAVRPLARATTPAIARQLRPFARAVQPLAATLRPAAARLAAATPPLARAVGVVNALLDELSYAPGSAQRSYLFWGAWLAHNAASLTSAQDANGPIVRGLFMASCPGLNLLQVTLQQSVPSLSPLIDLLNAPDWSKIHSSFCPPGGAG